MCVCACACTRPNVLGMYGCVPRWMFDAPIQTCSNSAPVLPVRNSLFSSEVFQVVRKTTAKAASVAPGGGFSSPLPSPQLGSACTACHSFVWSPALRPQHVCVCVRGACKYKSGRGGRNGKRMRSLESKMWACNDFAETWQKQHLLRRYRSVSFRLNQPAGIKTCAI